MTIAVMKKAAGFCLPAVFAIVSAAWGQFGTVSLPGWLADAGAAVETMVPVKPQTITYCEGPAVDRNGSLFFSEQNAGIIWKVTSAGAISRWKTNSPAYANGLDFGPDGYLYSCEQARITRLDTNGNLLKVVTSGTTWGQGANDLTFASNGDMFFTAFNQHFWYHSADSSVNRDYNYTAPANINFNGIEYLEERGIIYLCQWGQNRVMVCNVGANGAVDTASKRVFVTVNGPDGITVDSLYNVYVASNSGTTGSINVYDSAGVLLGSITMRQDNNPSLNASNCVFGGPGNKTLYITGDSGAYKVQLKVAGRVRPVTTSIKQAPGFFAPVSAARRQTSATLRLFLGANAPAVPFSYDGIGNAVLFNLLGQRARGGSSASTAVYILQSTTVPPGKSGQ
jgi:gluconolactonase